MRSATDAWLDLVWRRHRLVLVLAALFTLACAALATRLELRTNVAELLPSKDPAVEELQYLSKRIGGTSILQDRHREPRPRRQPALRGRARGRSCESSRPTPSRARSTTFAPSASLPLAQMAVCAAERARGAARFAARRDPQEEEPALRRPPRRGFAQGDRRAHAQARRRLRPLPHRLLRERPRAHRRHRLPAAGRPLRRARRREAGQGGRAHHQGRARRALPPEDAGGPHRRRDVAARGARTPSRAIW